MKNNIFPYIFIDVISVAGIEYLPPIKFSLKQQSPVRFNYKYLLSCEEYTGNMFIFSLYRSLLTSNNTLFFIPQLTVHNGIINKLSSNECEHKIWIYYLVRSKTKNRFNYQTWIQSELKCSYLQDVLFHIQSGVLKKGYSYIHHQTQPVGDLLSFTWGVVKYNFWSWSVGGGGVWGNTDVSRELGEFMLNPATKDCNIFMDVLTTITLVGFVLVVLMVNPTVTGGLWKSAVVISANNYWIYQNKTVTLEIYNESEQNNPISKWISRG